MQELKPETMATLNGGGWWFACGFGVVASASLLGLLAFGPATAAVCYCAVSGSCTR